MSVHALIAAQLTGLAVAAIAAVIGLEWWPTLAIGLVAAAVGFVPVRGRCLLDWAATLLRYPIRRAAALGETTDFRAPSGPVVGLLWDGGSVTAVVEVLPAPGNLTQVGRDGVESVHLLPVGALAESMTQHDINLSGIDVISHGYRAVAGSPAADVYDRLVGPLPATAVRTVWLALRLDATAEAESVSSRGGGSEGAARTVSIAAQRVVRTLADHGLPSRLLTAAQIGSAATQIGRGIRPESFTRAWNHVPLADACNSGFAIDPRSLSSEVLAALWARPSLGTTVTVRLRPGARPGEVRVAASCRLTNCTVPESRERPGPVSMSGRHADALASNLPGAPAHLDSLTPFTGVDRVRLDALNLPSSGCGQLLGSDDDGRGITTRVTGPEVPTVEVFGELYLAQQLVFRAVATGARILIHSDRAQDWEPLVESVATPDRLALALDPTRFDPAFTAVVFDGTEVRPLGGPATAIRVRELPQQPIDTEAALTIVQPGARGDRIVVHANGRQLDLILVTIAQETAFIGRPLAVDTVPATS
ncbi:type VII secretion protein EccE [Rhodococcus spelaei]|uniref:type VII secretion protein EccE n=1 Tax=Rhodococcus spelaei TaxID=2546320 RepID=UPI001FE5782B|nr:type VII secretion protein EccE [Rhodococcus spelaei]